MTNSIETPAEYEYNPFKEMVIDAICGAGFGSQEAKQEALNRGHAVFSSGQYIWKREALRSFTEESLQKLYEAIKEYQMANVQPAERKLIALLVNSRITRLLNELDDITRSCTAEELNKLHSSGVIPTGVLDWLIALKKASIAIKPIPTMAIEDKHIFETCTQEAIQRRKSSLESNIKYWTEHLTDDTDAKTELARCKQLYSKVLKEIEIENKKAAKEFKSIDWR